MAGYHRFHLKLDFELLREINSRSTYLCTSSASYVNRVFRRMLIYIDKIDISSDTKFIEDETTGFSKDLIISLEMELYDKLRYLHYRFQSFSMADILRKILRLYMIRLKEEISDILYNLKMFYEKKADREVYVEFSTHMILEKSKNIRTITINEKNKITSLTAYNPPPPPRRSIINFLKN